MLQAALNGSRRPGDHPALPLTPTALAADAAACVRAGAAAIHVHPRSASGHETLEPAAIDETVTLIRAATGVPVGVSTGAWIEPDPIRRAEHVSSWRAPDVASVNFSEHGAERVAESLLGAGIGVEAGIWSIDDVERLASSGCADRLARVLIEIVHPTHDPVAEAMAIEIALDRLGVEAPRLIHGEGAATWPVLRHAARRRCDARVGLEDTLRMPDGAIVASNPALVAVAVHAVASQH